jgi:siroheme synthase-like protein
MLIDPFIEGARSEAETGNHLFPVFLKLETLRVLIIGGGHVGLEKLQAVIQNSPGSSIRIIALEISDNIRGLAASRSNIELSEKAYDRQDLDDCDIIIAAVNNDIISQLIWQDAKQKGKLINVADRPEFCDFYMGSVVQKGNLKIAISTNGKSPTIAKRLKEHLHEIIPDEIENVLQNMQVIRKRMDGNFTEKVKQLNELTKVLVAKRTTLEQSNRPGAKLWQQVVKGLLFAFFFMILGHAIFSLIPLVKVADDIRKIPQYIDIPTFIMMLVTGFFAQMVDGSLGMGYGTISTTFLLAMGVNPAIVSSRVHSARVFSSGVSGYSHHRFGNINKKLFRTLIIPGVIGAVIGATLAFFGQKYSTWVRIPLSLYTIYLGYFIIRKAFKKRQYQNKVRHAGWLAGAGGLMDAFAGGGWGSLVTSTLIAKRRSPRYVIGSVCLAEFFVVFASSITFFIFLKNIPFIDIAGLILGGVVAAPIAARLVGKIPLKTMFVAVGSVVMLTSLITLWKSAAHLIAVG